MSRRRHSYAPDKPLPHNQADEEERQLVARILSVLPEDHPARIGWEKDDRTSAEVARLVPERPDLVSALQEAHWKGGVRRTVTPAYPIRGGLVVYPPKDNEPGSQTMGNPRLRAPFVCPICRCENYSQVYVKDRNGNQKATGAYQCKKCTVMFRDAEQFSERREIIGIALDQFGDEGRANGD